MDVGARARQLAEWIRKSDRAVVLTGAGVSTDSGIPDFRSPASGIWQHADPSKVASIQGFRADPLAFYAFWGERFVALGRAQPNVTHRVLAALEARGLVQAVITQNIDGLHQRAGSRRVLEVHGSWQRTRCLTCGERYDTLRLLAELRPGEVATCTLCSGLLKPDVVLFGEALTADFEDAERAVSSCDLLIVLGTSLGVWPVAGLAPRAHEAGARVAIVNRDPTPVDSECDLVVHGELRDVMTRIASELDLPR